MEYIDFTQKKIELHEEMENAIRSLMREKNVSEIDLTENEDEFGCAWIIRSRDDDGCLEEVQVTALKLEDDNLYYQSFGDEDWQSFDVMDTMVACTIACTIDSVYDAVYQRVNKM